MTPDHNAVQHLRPRIPSLVDSFSTTYIPYGVSGTVFWLDAQQIAGKSDNDDLTLWEDMSGNGHTFSGTATPPKYRTNIINGFPAIQFGIATSTSTKCSAFTLQYFTLFIVIRHGTQTSGAPILAQQDAVNSGIVLIVLTSPSTITWRNPNGNEVAGGTVSINTNYILTFQHSSWITGNVNNQQVKAGAGAASSRSAIFRLGNQEGSGNQYIGYIGEAILYNRELNRSEIDSIWDQLKRKWLLSF